MVGDVKTVGIGQGTNNDVEIWMQELPVGRVCVPTVMSLSVCDANKVKD